MTYILQITEIPENESLTSRVIMLTQGQTATLGSGFDCTLQLPDRSNEIAAIHARLIFTSNGLMLEATSRGKKILVNNTPILLGRPKIIDDGTVIALGGYTILVAESGTGYQQYGAVEAEEVQAPLVQEPEFSLKTDSLEDHPLHSDELHYDMEDSQAIEQPNDNNNYFSAQRVLSEDTLDDDPFERKPSTSSVSKEYFSDEYQDLHHGHGLAGSFKKHYDPVKDEAFVHNTQNVDDNDVELVFPALKKSLDGDNMGVMEKFEQNDENDSVTQNQTRLFQALDETLNVFLEEFSPDQLKERFSDYRRPWFGRSKYHWEMYELEYHRRHSRKEFHRIFKAILLDHLQQKND